MSMNGKVGRRLVLQGMAAATVSAGLARPAFAVPRTVKIGVVMPLSGPLALFSETATFALGQVKRVYGGQIKINGANHPYEIIVKDSQSSPNRAAEVALELILTDKVDLVVASATPETTNPVADQCELNGVPCLTTVAPVEAWFNGRQGDPAKGFEWTYHFFVSAGKAISSFMNIWKRVGTDHCIGLLLPNDTDGNVFSQLVPAMAKASGIGDWKIIDPGRFDTPANNFAPQIEALKQGGADVCYIVAPAPDFTVFWNQAAQAGYRPRMVTPSKIGEFPAVMMPMGERARNFCIEVWWSRTYPFASGMTGQTAAELADEFEKANGTQASMALGYDHALYELAFDTLRRTRDIDSRESVRDALKATQYKSVVGPVGFGGGPFPNTAETPVVGGQWRKGAKWPLELVIVDNTHASEIPVQGAPEALW